MLPHPSKEIKETKGRELLGKQVVLCITGSVAAVRSPRIARTLMRYGAEVFTVMSSMAQKIIHPYVMEWATGNAVVTELTGKIEHVALAGKHRKRADLVLVAPATANTISKIACGIDDTTVTSVVSTAFGSNIPIIVVPAMHESMYDHPILTENIRKLERLKVEFVGPRIDEGKAKIAETNEIAERVIQRLLRKQDFAGFRFLVTAGPTIEYIDPIRVISNRSSGKMGMAIAKEAAASGADVTLIYGPGTEEPPTEARVVRVETTEQMREAVISEVRSKRYDVVMAVAAAADWKAERTHSHKLSTRESKTLRLNLTPTEKIIKHVKKASPNTFLVAFCAEFRKAKKELIESAYRKLLEANADLIVVNDVAKRGVGFETETNEVFIVDGKKKSIHIPLLTKREVASKILGVLKEKHAPK